jgi:hypothetical protein
MKGKSYYVAFFILIASCRSEKPPAPTNTAVTPPTHSVVSITSISPDSAVSNTLITIRGKSFGDLISGDTVKFNGTIAQIQSETDTTITVLAPMAGTNGAITVSAPPGKASGPVFTYNPDIYIVGTVRKPLNYMVTYWKNGTAYYLTDPLGYGTATGLVLSDTDVYIAGSVADGSGVLQGRYWKNRIEGTLSQGLAQHTTGGIAVSGSDVYVAGFENPTVDTVYFNTAEYWKNGTQTLLTTPPEYAQATAVAVHGNDLYVTGSTIYPNNGFRGIVYWKNGVENHLAVSGGTASGIVITGNNDIYISGDDQTGSNHAMYWKNGTEVMLASSATTTCIVVSGNDVYVGGMISNGTHNVAVYWKNGVQVTLTDGVTDAEVNGITIVGNDIYACGYRTNSPTQNPLYPDANPWPVYWKNGMQVVLVDPKLAAGYASSIVVIPHGK